MSIGLGLWDWALVQKQFKTTNDFNFFWGQINLKKKKLKRYLDTRPYSVMNYQSRLNLVPNSDPFWIGPKRIDRNPKSKHAQHDRASLHIHEIFSLVSYHKILSLGEAPTWWEILSVNHQKESYMHGKCFIVMGFLMVYIYIYI